MILPEWQIRSGRKPRTRTRNGTKPHPATVEADALAEELAAVDEEIICLIAYRRGLAARIAHLLVPDRREAIGEAAA